MHRPFLHLKFNIERLAFIIMPFAHFPNENVSPEIIFGALSSRALVFIGVIVAVFVAVAHPNARYAFYVITFEFIFWARLQFALGFVLTIRTVFNAIASFARINTKCRLIR